MADEFGHLDNLSDTHPDSDIENAPPCKRRRVYGLYIKVQEFDTLDSAKEHVKTKATYKFKVRRETLQGMKYFYNCIVSAKCSSKAYIHLPGILARIFFICSRLNSAYFFTASSQQAHYFETEAAHNHEGEKRTIGMPGPTKDAVGLLYEQGITKPNAIIAELRRQHLPTAKKIPTSKFSFLQKDFGRAQHNQHWTVGQNL